MPTWSNRPPKPNEFAGIRLVRVAPKGHIRGLITSPKLVGCFTHYYRQRTAPCTGQDCQACLEGHAPRWHGYLSFIHSGTFRHEVIELTALAAQPVADFEDRNGTLRGAVLDAERTGTRPNAPVNVTVTAHDSDHQKLPRPVDLELFLETIWSPNKKPTETAEKPHPGPNIRNIPDAKTAQRGKIPDPAAASGNGQATS